MEKLFYFRAYLRYLVLIDPEKRGMLIKEMQKLGWMRKRLFWKDEGS
jgi:hypothetical protein